MHGPYIPETAVRQICFANLQLPMNTKHLSSSHNGQTNSLFSQIVFPVNVSVWQSELLHSMILNALFIMTNTLQTFYNIMLQHCPVCQSMRSIWTVMYSMKLNHGSVLRSKLYLSLFLQRLHFHRPLLITFCFQILYSLAFSLHCAIVSLVFPFSNAKSTHVYIQPA